MEFDVTLKNFLDSDGRLTKYPSKRRPRMTALYYVAARFSPETDYTQGEVNDIIQGSIAFGDVCFVRRELIDYKFLSREKNGSVYWLTDPQPQPEKLGLSE